MALLLGLAGGKLWGYEGSILVTEGQGFCNSFQQYDTYSSGPLVDSGDLTPLCVDLEDFRAKYEDEPDRGLVHRRHPLRRARARTGRPTTIGVNEPLRVDGDRVYVTGHGYSPTFTVTRPDGTAFTDVSVPFLPTDQTTMASEGALKLPDLGAGERRPARARGVLRADRPGAGRHPHLGRPAAAGPAGRDRRLPGLPRPGLRHPAVGLLAGRRARSTAAGSTEVAAANLAVGESTTLPDGTTVAFTGYQRVRRAAVSHDPGQVWVLGAAIALLLGLLGMLLLRRERVFARVAAAPGGGGTVLTLASLTRGSGESAPAVRRPDRRPGRRARRPRPPHRTPEDTPRDS